LQYTDSSHIRVSYKTLYIGAIITCGGIIIFLIIAHACGIRYEIRDIVAMLTCGIVSTTLIYHAKNLKLNFDANQEKLDFDKKKFEEEKVMKKNEQQQKKIVYSFEASTLWFKADMAKHVEVARGFLLRNKDILLNGPIGNIVSEMDKDQEIRRAIICVLNYFENLSLMIKYDIADEETLKLCFKTAFVDYHKVLRRYIDEVQNTSRRYLMNFEEIAEKWSKN
jgi:hypothetical protein